MSSSLIPDFLIIGGGVIGLAVARELRRLNAGSVMVVERGEAGKEASDAAGGMLAVQAETDRADDFFRFCRESNGLYPDFAAALLEETGIDIELDRRGTLYLAFTEEDSAEIGHRYDWQSAAGLAVCRVGPDEARRMEPHLSPAVREALLFPDDWQVENRRLIAALRRYAGLNGIVVREQTPVTGLDIEGGRVAAARTAGGPIRAGTFVIATGAWTSLIETGGLPMPPVGPVRGQMIAFGPAARMFERVIYSPRGYLVPRADGRLLAGATVENAGFDKRTTAEGVEAVRKKALEIAPGLATLNIGDKWAGLRPHAPDGLPVLGQLPWADNAFVATAHYRNGILLAPATARLMASRVASGEDSHYFTHFGTERF